jgi:hypothetical protein
VPRGVIPEFFGATSYIFKKKQKPKKKTKKKKEKKMKIELGGCLFSLGVIQPPPRPNPELLFHH